MGLPERGQEQKGDFNINDVVQFRLTDYGKKLYSEYVESRFQKEKIGGHDLRKFALEQIEPNEDGMSELQLWKLMEVFGPSIDHGGKTIFVDNKLYFPQVTAEAYKINKEEEKRGTRSMGEVSMITQELSLISPDDTKILTVDIQMSEEVETGVRRGHYIFRWLTDLSTKDLIPLIEKTVSYYEETYEGTTREKDRFDNSPFFEIEESKGEEREEVSLYTEGKIITYKKEDGKFETLREMGLERPLNFEQLSELVGNNEITFLRLNTLIGDFGITPAKEGKDNSFGVMSDIKQVEGLINLATKTSSSQFNPEDAKQLVVEAASKIEEFREKQRETSQSTTS